MCQNALQDQNKRLRWTLSNIHTCHMLKSSTNWSLCFLSLTLTYTKKQFKYNLLTRMNNSNDNLPHNSTPWHNVSLHWDTRWKQCDFMVLQISRFTTQRLCLWLCVSEWNSLVLQISSLLLLQSWQKYTQVRNSVLISAAVYSAQRWTIRSSSLWEWW